MPSLLAINKSDRAINDEMQDFLNRYPPLPGIDVRKYDFDRVCTDPEVLGIYALRSEWFAALIESNPSPPAERLHESAERSKASWLHRFVDDTWLPQESTHSEPFQMHLLHSGFAKNWFTKDWEDYVHQQEFTIGKDYTAMMAVTYGWLQELLTLRFYQALFSHIRNTNVVVNEGRYKDPVLAQILIDIGKQENFHRHFYLTAMRTTLKHRPDLKEEFIEALTKFDMPHTVMLPDCERYSAGKFAKHIGFDTKSTASDIASVVLELGGYEGMGRAAMLYSANHMPSPKDNVYAPFALAMPMAAKVPLLPLVAGIALKAYLPFIKNPDMSKEPFLYRLFDWFGKLDASHSKPQN
ncbi:MAG: acyl-ACP desaturase [Nanoarchaeota archaeon]